MDKARSRQLAYEAAQHVIASGLGDDSDEDALADVLGAWLHRHGMIPEYTYTRCRYTLTERREIVDDYVKYASTTRNPSKRAAKIRDLGVSPDMITRWARNLYGPGALARVGPTPSSRIVVDYLRDHPWSSRRKILTNTGVVRTSLSGALHWCEQRGEISKRLGKDGRYEYALAGA